MPCTTLAAASPNRRTSECNTKPALEDCRARRRKTEGNRRLKPARLCEGEGRVRNFYLKIAANYILICSLLQGRCKGDGRDTEGAREGAREGGSDVRILEIMNGPADGTTGSPQGRRARWLKSMEC